MRLQLGLILCCLSCVSLTRWRPHSVTNCDGDLPAKVLLVATRPNPIRLISGYFENQFRLRYRLQLQREVKGRMRMRVRLHQLPNNSSQDFGCLLIRNLISAKSNFTLHDLCELGRISSLVQLNRKRHKRFCRRKQKRRLQLVPRRLGARVLCLCRMRPGLYRQESVIFKLPPVPLSTYKWASCIDGGYRVSVNIDEATKSTSGARYYKPVACFNVTFELRIKPSRIRNAGG